MNQIFFVFPLETKARSISSIGRVVVISVVKYSCFVRPTSHWMFVGAAGLTSHHPPWWVSFLEGLLDFAALGVKRVNCLSHPMQDGRRLTP